MDNFQNNIYGTNTMFRSPLARSVPAFQSRPLGVAPEQTFRPQTADLESVNPMFRSIYQRFNDSVADLQRGEEAARGQAGQSRDILVGDYNRGVQQAEQQRVSNIDQARRANQDAQTSNRIRARAIGGAPSSGFLELATRLDESAGRNINEANTQATNRIGQVESDINKSLFDIESRLNQTLAQIESDRRLSLRERDAAVAQAEEAAAQEALRRAAASAQAGNMDLLNALFGGGDQSTGSVLGEQTTNEGNVLGIDVEQGGDTRWVNYIPGYAAGMLTNRKLQNLANEGKLTDAGYYGKNIGRVVSNPKNVWNAINKEAKNILDLKF